jgi:predicted acetyltransferase
MLEVSVRPVGPASREVVERLWLMFRHDMSEYVGGLPYPDGTFRSERMEAALTDPDWAAYLMTSGESPVGIAFVRSLGGPARVMNTFFVVRGARREGVGLRFAREVVGRHPGAWEVAFQDYNPGAVRFWRRVATEVAGEAWTEEPRPVPHRPELPPDVWISFTAEG